LFQGCDPEHKDRFGRTPMEELKDENNNLLELLEWGVSLKKESPVCSNGI
jgi:hypothetical protein